MKNRLRLSQGASVLLGLGPVLAGAQAQTLSVVVVFSGLFALAEACLRPKIGLSPGRDRALLRLFGVGLQGLLILGLVLALFGLGRAGAALFGPLQPSWLAVGLSLCALPIFYFSTRLPIRPA